MTHDLWATLRKMSARKEGVSTAEAMYVLGYNQPKIGRSCQTLIHRGEMFVLRVSHKYARYFSTEAGRDAYAAKLAANQARSLRVMHTPVKTQGLKAGWGPDTPVKIPKGVKVQVCPSHDPRNTVHEFPFIHQRRGL